jgi:hypothetical protein
MKMCVGVQKCGSGDPRASRSGDRRYWLFFNADPFVAVLLWMTMVGVCKGAVDYPTGVSSGEAGYGFRRYYKA